MINIGERRSRKLTRLNLAGQLANVSFCRQLSSCSHFVTFRWVLNSRPNANTSRFCASVQNVRENGPRSPLRSLSISFFSPQKPQKLLNLLACSEKQQRDCWWFKNKLCAEGMPKCISLEIGNNNVFGFSLDFMLPPCHRRVSLQISPWTQIDRANICFPISRVGERWLESLLRPHRARLVLKPCRAFHSRERRANLREANEKKLP